MYTVCMYIMYFYIFSIAFKCTKYFENVFPHHMYVYSPLPTPHSILSDLIVLQLFAVYKVEISYLRASRYCGRVLLLILLLLPLIVQL